eukprot:6573359-Prymnesium_polylepis.1
MVGLSERQVIEDELDEPWVEPSANFFCERVLHGVLYGQRVLLVTTGIGHDHASICMSDLLRTFDGRLKDIFFLGACALPRRGRLDAPAPSSAPTPEPPSRARPSWVSATTERARTSSHSPDRAQAPPASRRAVAASSTPTTATWRAAAGPPTAA